MLTTISQTDYHAQVIPPQCRGQLEYRMSPHRLMTCLLPNNVFLLFSSSRPPQKKCKIVPYQDDNLKKGEKHCLTTVIVQVWSVVENANTVVRPQSYWIGNCEGGAQQSMV